MLISIIIPVYNGEKFIEKCIDSVLNQSFSNIELILVDDCSTDNSLNIANKIKSKDKEFKFIKLKTMPYAALLGTRG